MPALVSNTPDHHQMSPQSFDKHNISARRAQLEKQSR